MEFNLLILWILEREWKWVVNLDTLLCYQKNHFAGRCICYCIMCHGVSFLMFRVLGMCKEILGLTK